MSKEATAQLLRNIAARDDRLVHERTLDTRVGKTALWPEWMNGSAVKVLSNDGSLIPWTHQVETFEAVHKRKHVIITTSTGSGKSLAAWGEFFSALADYSQTRTGSLADIRKRPSALYISPTKALAADQVSNFNRWINQADFELRVGVADGDSSADGKRWASNYADIVATNPDFLHHVILARHEHWSRILRSLRLIVLDEVHYFRGMAAANVALVLRRLIRLAKRLGADPTVVLLSATTADPVDLCVRYLGCHTDEVIAVTQDGSPAGKRTVMIWQPAQITNENEVDDLDPSFLMPDFDDVFAAHIQPAPIQSEQKPEIRRATPTVEAALLTTLMARGKHRVLTFVRSRNAVEAVADMVRRNLEMAEPGIHNSIAGYRGGYLPHERRELEQRLRSGELTGLVTTSALEIGIDIAELDATISCSWPGTRASFWQQSGRAGRAGGSALNVLIAGDNPLDAYFVQHPDALFDSVEAIVFDATNPHVLGPHLCSAAAETPLTKADFSLFGARTQQTINELEAAGMLRHRPDGWRWNVALSQSPHELVDVRGNGFEVQIVNAIDGSVIGSVNESRVNATVHPGARYVHQGNVYRVEQLDEDIALAVPDQSNLRTRPWIETHIRIIDTDQIREMGAFQLNTGDIEVSAHARSYDLLRLPGLEFAGEHKLDLPDRTYKTRAVWWTVSTAWLHDQGLTIDVLPGALHAAEHASIGVLPLLATCDRWDLGGLSTTVHAGTGLATVFVHDANAGGSGISDFGFEHALDWWQHTLYAVADCPCREGCPRCIVSPKCGNGNKPLFKHGAATLLHGLVTATREYDS